MNGLLQTLFSFMFFFLGIHVVLASDKCTDDQRAVLFQLRDTLEYNSSLSTRLVSWDQNTHFCIWNGVICNLEGEVIGLDLSQEGIYGGINNSSILFYLEKLQRLNLAYNNFNFKPIPSRFGNLTSLVYLNLSNSYFSGQVPGEFSQMTRLEVLDLSSFFSYGYLSLKLEKPNLAMLVKNLQHLTDLYLDGVNISAHKSDWCQVISSSLPSLKVLSFSDCYLSGPIDESLQKLQSLSIINLSRNNLRTHVPDFFANFTNLTVLNLAVCNLNGKFPKKVLQLPRLEILDLSENERLHGSLLGLPKNGLLRNLVLSGTNFSNAIPESIGDLKMLSRLELDRSRFNGHIPQSIGNLTNLSYLDLSSNNFTGRIPSFQLCKNLLHIDLSRNSLSGSIPPAHFQNLHNLVTVDLRFNTFKGSMPLSLFSLPLVQKIHLSNNNFEGPLVNFSKASISLLQILELSSNRLEGEIPKSFFGLKNLSVLLLSSNNLRGTILSKAFQGLLNLKTLDLSYNNLSIETSSRDFNTSPFPQFSTLKLASCNLWTFPDLKNQSMLYILDLSDNNIGGEIPSWIWGSGNGTLSYLNISHNELVGFQKPYMFPESLDVLDLHSNRLGGVIPIPPPFVAYVDYSENLFSSSIPDGIGSNLTRTIFFSVSRNSLTGPIPQTICNANWLKVLDLSHNGFGGRIPECLLEFGRDLGVLQLGNNNLNGVIEGTFTSNCRLVTLDLYGNSLEGKIPQSLANCKLLEVLNIGNNRINDTYPCFLRNNTNLRALILRSNRLYGGVHCNPAPSSSWEKLQILDIAINNFTGVVPADWFRNWHAMMTDEDRPQSYEKHLSFRVLQLNELYYQQTVIVSIKGLELELVKIPTIFTSIDISNNHFGGDIPSTIGQLKMLYLLNMSHNEFTGSIPPSIGGLYQIESLDLSANKLVGEIPSVLTGLSFLSSFNLSYNQLEGKIPVGSQFQTFTGDSYKGNRRLCGFPLNQNCNVSRKATTPPASTESAHDNTVNSEDLISVGVGFVVGLGIFILPLIFYGRWSRWYYQHMERIFFKKLHQYYERRNRMRRAYKNPIRRL